MKRVCAVFALTTLGAAAVALAQQPTPQTPAEPPASTSPQEQSPATPPSDPSTSSSAEKQTMMKDCTTQIKAANPGVPDKVINDYCDKQVNQPAPQN
jgi:cytoskeletal protein RodZ